MDEAKVKQIAEEVAKQVFQDQLNQSQFGVTAVPVHTHNGTDTVKIPASSVIDFISLLSRNTSNDTDGIPDAYSGVVSNDNISPFVTVDPTTIYPTPIVGGFGNGGGSPDYSVFHGGEAPVGSLVAFYRNSAVSTTAQLWIALEGSSLKEGFQFTGALAMGATSATLAVDWAWISGDYTVKFSNGNTRLVTFTINDSTATWTGGLSAVATDTFNVFIFTQWWGVDLTLNPTL